ncbi:hypothetical protein MMC07_006758 [Pseudocyphellaria aurata]|nr:hypothetical protein [Pseudocyphellaria aurata]
MRIYNLSVPLLLFFRGSVAIPTIYTSLDSQIKTDGLFNTFNTDTSSYLGNSVEPDGLFKTDESFNTGNSIYSGSQPVKIGFNTDSINSNEGLDLLLASTNLGPGSTNSDEVPNRFLLNPSVGQNENTYLAEEPDGHTILCYETDKWMATKQCVGTNFPVS